MEPIVRTVTDPHRLDIEAIKSSPAGKKSVVQVRIDADERPSSDLLETVSNELSAAFDAAEEVGQVNFGAGYTLEVSTPGVDTPLTKPRHWRRNRTRLVKVGDAIWRIGAVNDEETAVILVERGAKILDVHEFSPETRAVVEIEFNNPPAAELELAGLTFDEAIEWREDHK